MQPLNNNEKRSEETTNSTTHDTETKSCEKEWEDTGNKLGWKKKPTLNEFISKARKVHGDKYGYKKVKYINCETNITLLCQIHGAFNQQPRHHLNGSGCKKCRCESRHLALRTSTEEFIQKAKRVHFNYYDYSLVDYKNWRINVKIICPKHGIFEQIPNHHLRGSGCPNCYCFISKAETACLNFLNVPERNVKLKEWRKKKIDGYDSSINTIYEFLGDYWHGNPSIKKFSHEKVHPVTKLSYGKMYERTFITLNKIKSFGYIVKYIWENDWYNFIQGKTNYLNLQTL